MKKPLSTVDLVLSVLGMMKSLGIVFSVVLLDWANSRAAKEKHLRKIAETEKTITDKEIELLNESKNKDAITIIDDFIESERKSASNHPEVL